METEADKLLVQEHRIAGPGVHGMGLPWGKVSMEFGMQRQQTVMGEAAAMLCLPGDRYISCGENAWTGAPSLL